MSSRTPEPSPKPPSRCDSTVAASMRRCWTCATRRRSRATWTTWPRAGRWTTCFCNAGVGFRQPYCDITKREDWNTCIPQPIGIEQAGDEILDGIRNGDQVIPLNDDARRLYQAIREGRPEYVEEAIRIVKARALEGMETTAAAPAVGT